MTASSVDLAATICLGLAVLHTFLVSQFQRLALKFPEGSISENIFHLLGEVEVVFGFWAAIYLVLLAMTQNLQTAIHYLETRNFTEPAFVFTIMTVCSTRPILVFASKIIESLSRLLPLQKPTAFFIAALSVGPIFGSFITEPAAMTVTALILFRRFYSQGISREFMYATLGVLFVNVSIGGTLTPYAAPPVLMVASKWNWDLMYMLTNFGWKGTLATFISTLVVAYRFRKELQNLKWNSTVESTSALPIWITVIHLIFLFLIVLSAHHISVFIGLLLFFLGLVNVTKEFHEELEIKSGLLVAFFLGGLVVLGGPQRWWIEPILQQLDSAPLFFGAIGLTAVIDNAALTYLGSQVPNLSEAARYFLVAGSVVGGGLTVIANAPNPAGYGILNPAFGNKGISPAGLFKSALLPTGVAALCYYFL